MIVAPPVRTAAFVALFEFTYTPQPLVRLAPPLRPSALDAFGSSAKIHPPVDLKTPDVERALTVKPLFPSRYEKRPGIRSVTVYSRCACDFFFFIIIGSLQLLLKVRNVPG